jgi:hypothetical protein
MLFAENLVIHWNSCSDDENKSLLHSSQQSAAKSSSGKNLETAGSSVPVDYRFQEFLSLKMFS